MLTRWAEVQGRLEAAGILQVLAPYRPVVAGTFPLGLDTDASDVDILCEISDAEAFSDVAAQHFGRWPGFSIHRKADANPLAVVCRFTLDGLMVEVFAQPLEVKRQRAFRHMMVEQRLLAAAGPAAHEALRNLRAQGLNTEPAFARYFGLEGDPHEALLRLADCSDGELALWASRAQKPQEA